MIPEHVFTSEAWRHLAAYINGEIFALHKRNAQDLSEVDTAKTRGELKFAQRLLDLASKRQPIAPAKVDEYIT